MGASKTVAVLGAGVSGLTAARYLREAGYPVIVFDKGRNPGGRISSRTSTAFSGAFDHGAQYLTARDPEFVDRVRSWCAAGCLAPWKPAMAVSEGGRVVLKSGPSSGETRYVGTPSMRSLGLALSENLDVRCGVEVGSVRIEGERRLGLRDTLGTELGVFDGLAVTFPAPQTGLLLSALAPDVAQAASSVVYHPAWAVMLEYEGLLAVPPDAVFVNDGPLSFVTREASKPQREARDRYVLHASPKWSAEHLEFDAERVADALEGAFREVFGLRALAPSVRLAHRWRYARPVKPLEALVLTSSRAAIGAAGDWTAGSRVEDAWRAGRALGERLARGLGAGAVF